MALVWQNIEAERWAATELSSASLFSREGLEQLEASDLSLDPSGRPGQPDRSVQSAKTDRSDQSARSDRADHSGLADRGKHADTLTIPAEGVLVIPRCSDASDTIWIALAAAGAGVYINGQRLAAGIRVLADRDSIRLGTGPVVFFSTERRAEIETFAGRESLCCPRCKLDIEPGHAVVRCPSCGVVHHERVSEDHRCWTMAKTCTFCDQSTDLDAGEYRWTPDAL